MNRVYLISNEFQLLFTLFEYYKYRLSPKGTFKVIISYQRKSRRLTIDKYNLPFEYIVIQNIFNDLPASDEVPYEKLIKEFINDTDFLFLYHDALLFNTYIIRLFKKLYGCKVILLQEGIAGYYRSRFDLSFFLRNFLKFIYFRILKKYDVKIVKSWGLNNDIDEVLMINPENVRERIRSKISKIDIDFNENTINLAINDFNFNIDERLKSKEKVFLYLAMGYTRKFWHYKEKELAFLREMIDFARNKGYSIVIKAKGNEDLGVYREIIDNDCTFITEAIPAELLTYAISNSVICSFISSANLYQKNNNKYAWIYPVVGFKGVHNDYGAANIELIREIDDFKKLF